MSELTGIVTRSTGSWSTVKLEDGKRLECRLRGNLRIKGIRTTNPVAVGDVVSVTLEEGNENQGLISGIAERKNYLVRKSVNLSKRAHVIAANLDRIIVLATVAEPRTSLGFINRIIASAEAFNVEATVVFNKLDMLNELGQEILAEYRAIYENVGYSTMAVSAIKGDGIEEFKSLLAGKTSLIVGHSGVGKSTLINAVQPGIDLKVGEISAVHSKGKHTTTFAEMFDLELGGSIIDTPGIKEFGTVNMDNDPIGHYFREIFEASEDCKFHNCKHVNEPQCNVISKIEDGTIDGSRYDTYLSMLEELEDQQ